MAPATTRPTGRRPPKNAPAIAFASLRASAGEQQITAQDLANETPHFPPTLDYIVRFPDWQPLGNNKYSDCNAATWGNQRRLVTHQLSKQGSYPTEAQVLEFYQTQNRKFNPHGDKATDGPDSKEDGGMDIQTGLEWLVEHGGPDGQHAVCFSKVNAQNIDDVHAAIAIFGSLWIGMDFWNENNSQFDAHQPWTVVKGKGPAPHGHAVVVGGYLPNMKFVTWGDTAEFAPDFWQSQVNEAWAVAWPEHFGTRSFMLGIDMKQMAAQYEKLTRSKIKFPAAPFSRLFFIKTKNVESGNIEVHYVDEHSSYLEASHQASWFSGGDADNGIWSIDDQDLYFIKTKNTGTGMVEVHRVSESSSFKQADIHTETAFTLADADDGVWTVDNGDLYFIKTKNTGSGKVEVHRVSSSNWKTFASHNTTPIDIKTFSGTFDIHAGNLYYIQHAIPGQKTLLFRFRANDDYMKYDTFDSWFDYSTDWSTGTWDVGPNGDLYFIRHEKTSNGHVQITVATWESSYKQVKSYNTWFSTGDSRNGTWCVR